MIPCVFTQNFGNTTHDGFFTMNDGNLILYDDKRRKIYSTTAFEDKGDQLATKVCVIKAKHDNTAKNSKKRDNSQNVGESCKKSKINSKDETAFKTTVKISSDDQIFEKLDPKNPMIETSVSNFSELHGDIADSSKNPNSTGDNKKSNKDSKKVDKIDTYKKVCVTTNNSDVPQTDFFLDSDKEVQKIAMQIMDELIDEVINIKKNKYVGAMVQEADISKSGSNPHGVDTVDVSLNPDEKIEANNLQEIEVMRDDSHNSIKSKGKMTDLRSSVFDGDQYAVPKNHDFSDEYLEEIVKKISRRSRKIILSQFVDKIIGRVVRKELKHILRSKSEKNERSNIKKALEATRKNSIVDDTREVVRHNMEKYKPKRVNRKPDICTPCDESFGEDIVLCKSDTSDVSLFLKDEYVKKVANEIVEDVLDDIENI